MEIAEITTEFITSAITTEAEPTLTESITITQPSSIGRVKFITLTLTGDVVTREWGLVGGKTQSTSNQYNAINKGKSNELSPEQAARGDYLRIIKRKAKEGYLPKGEAPKESPLDFTHIPTEFCCSKPNSKLNEAKVNKGLSNDRTILQEKYNGLCHYVLVTPEGEIKLYTRRMDDHTAKYHNLVKALKESEFCPPNTILIGELCVDPKLGMPHMEAFKRACEISRVDTLEGKLKDALTESLIRQSKHAMRLAIFGVLYYGGEDIASDCTYEKIYYETIAKMPSVNSLSPFFQPTLVEVKTIEEAKKYLKDNGVRLEGLVAWMLEEKMEVTFNGKPNRRAAFKIKLPKEEDVIAYGFEEGKGDHQGKIGSLLIGKYNAAGKMVPLGKCGSGLTDADCDPATWTFPQVIEIIYNEKFPTGKYQFPRFSKKHEDKVVGDCELVD